MYSIIIVKRTDAFYSEDRPGYLVVLRDKSINSCVSIGTFDSPEKAYRVGLLKAKALSLDVGEVDTEQFDRALGDGWGLALV